MIFLPRDPELYDTAKAAIHKVGRGWGWLVLGGWYVDGRGGGGGPAGAWGTLCGRTNIPLGLTKLRAELCEAGRYHCAGTSAECEATKVHSLSA